MTDPNVIILYVKNPEKSASFYADLLGKPPVEASHTFVMFALESGLMLGLWAKDGVEPRATAMPGCGELALPVDNKDEVNTLYADWSQRRLDMAQAPCQMDFGYTFVALDPDGHRLRVFAPSRQ